MHDGAECVGLEDHHMPLLDLDEAIIDKLREHAAHRPKFEPQETANFLACPAQHTPVAGVAASVQAPHQVESKRRQPGIGPHAAPQNTKNSG